MSDKVVRQPITVVCSVCKLPARVLAGSIWAASEICTPCYVCRELEAGREAEMTAYRAIFTPAATAA